MSIPITCHKKEEAICQSMQSMQETRSTREDNQPSIHDVLLYINEPEYDLLLREFVRTSIASIVGIFFSNQWPEVACHLYRHTLNASTGDCLVLFYLLLNVDVGLKKKILLIDNFENRAKHGRFFFDLKHTLVPAFYNGEKCSLGQFVNDCQDAYIIS